MRSNSWSSSFNSNFSITIQSVKRLKKGKDVGLLLKNHLYIRFEKREKRSSF